MPVFKVGEPVETNESVVAVDIDPDAPLLPGDYIFELVVVDDAGNRSPAAVAKVTITDPGPVAVIHADEQVPFGGAFKLDGSESRDIPPGQVVNYIWTMTQPG